MNSALVSSLVLFSREISFPVALPCNALFQEENVVLGSALLSSENLEDPLYFNDSQQSTLCPDTS